MRSGHARGIGRAGIGRPLAAVLSRYHAPNLNKGTFVDPLLRRLVVPPMAVAALGDMENDLAMFGKVGRSIAMGNANAEEGKRITSLLRMPTTVLHEPSSDTFLTTKKMKELHEPACDCAFHSCR
jgi:hypothetical protein